jgi:predicted flap endonuclease-1-like 5' DNA nuclease
MGPLELADFIGLDTCLAIMNVLHDGLADTKYRPCPLLVKVCRGRLARPQDPAGLLRLSRRDDPGAHPLDWPIGDAPAEAAADLDPDPQDSSGSAGTPAILAPREMVCSAAPADEPSARAQTAEDAPEIPEIPAFRDTDGPHVPPGLPLEETAASAFIAAERDPLSPAPRAPVDDGAPKGNPAPSVAEDIATGSVCPGQAMSAPPEGAEEDGLPHQAAMQGGTPAGYAIHAPVGDQGCSREMPVQHGHGWPHESAAASSRVTPEGGELAAASERDASDLHKIPGIGSGLVWMLESAGVASLEDLARSDARALGERLGTISRLLDLDYFVAQARTRTSAVGRG